MKYWKGIFSLLGFAALFFIIHDYGFDHLRHQLEFSGWLIVPLILSFIPTLLCYSLAWQLCTGNRHTRSSESFFKLSFHYFRFTIISIAWNNLSPFLKVFGEPAKVSLLSEFTDTKNALRSVVIYNMVHLVGTVLAFLAAALLIPPIFRPGHTVELLCYGAVALFFVILALLLWLPKLTHGFLRKHKFNRLRAASLWTRWSFRQVTKFYTTQRTAFSSAVLLEVLARFIEGFTFYVAFRIVGQPLTFLSSAFLEVGRALFDNLFFFVPYQVGSREFGISILLENVLHASKDAFVAAALLYRLVEIFWVALGYALWVKSGLRRKV